MAHRILTEQMWQRVAALLPPERGHRGRPAKDNRQMLEAMLWRLQTGAPWRDLSPEWGPWGTVYRRFERWNRTGVWQRVLEELERHDDEEWLLIDRNSYTPLGRGTRRKPLKDSHQTGMSVNRNVAP